MRIIHGVVKLYFDHLLGSDQRLFQPFGLIQLQVQRESESDQFLGSSALMSSVHSTRDPVSVGRDSLRSQWNAGVVWSPPHFVFHDDYWPTRQICWSPGVSEGQCDYQRPIDSARNIPDACQWFLPLAAGWTRRPRSKEKAEEKNAIRRALLTFS